MTGKNKLGIVIVLVVIVGAIFFANIHYKTEKRADKTGMKNSFVCKNEDNDWVKIPQGFYRDGTGACVEGTSPPPPAPPAPPKISGITPTGITADYGFSLEADAPIMVQYPEEKPFLFTPGGPCNQLPQPKHSGLKKFWDPKDPKNGHIYFRLYRGAGKC